MTGIDSLKLATQDRDAFDIDLRKFKAVTYHDSESTVYRAVNDLRRPMSYDLGLGISRIEFNSGTGLLTVEGSAKALAADYPTGIRESTWEQWIDAVNKSGAIRLDCDSSMDFVVCRVDPFIDLICPDPLHVLRLVSLLGVNPKYNATTEGYGNTVYLRSRNTRSKKTFRAYNKSREMQLARNKVLRTIAGAMFTDPTVRFEIDGRRRAHFRSMVDKPYDSITIKALLQSVRNPVADLFDSICDSPEIALLNRVTECRHSNTKPDAAVLWMAIGSALEACRSATDARRIGQEIGSMTSASSLDSIRKSRSRWGKKVVALWVDSQADRLRESPVGLADLRERLRAAA